MELVVMLVIDHVFTGEDLEECSNDPLTGWFRDGCCNTDENDHGVHTVCAKVTTECLEWLKEAGNDLITPHPEFGFPGLKDGDKWCLCSLRWLEAYHEGVAPPILLKSTNKLVLNHIDIEILKNYTIKLLRQNVNHDYVLTNALVRILEMEDEMNKKKRFGLFSN